ncbi:hypothetical protein HDV57DRAFT_411627 [Trichoderma longibrachiatum]|uniref:Uncharacterized protein n=1 Tax=Trichoderma longibrachiatum ATCC 18648 TaxID=983965 RepID=A0A2T4C2Q0_TRILO|nr:hypothetical protein M440DRAFT_1260971 [Trichoderma longibrachiatum ATCC 18648]
MSFYRRGSHVRDGHDLTESYISIGYYLGSYETSNVTSKSNRTLISANIAGCCCCGQGERRQMMLPSVAFRAKRKRARNRPLVQFAYIHSNGLCGSLPAWAVCLVRNLGESRSARQGGHSRRVFAGERRRRTMASSYMYRLASAVTGEGWITRQDVHNACNVPCSKGGHTHTVHTLAG